MPSPLLAVNDPVLRVCGSCQNARLRISALTRDSVFVGPFRFDRLTLTELDDFGAPGPSYLVLLPTSGILGHLAQSELHPDNYL